MVVAVPIPEAPDIGDWHDLYGDCLYVVARQDGTLLSGAVNESGAYLALRTHRLDGEQLPLYAWTLEPVYSSEAGGAGVIRQRQVAALVTDTFTDAPTIVSAGGGFRA